MVLAPAERFRYNAGLMLKFLRNRTNQKRIFILLALTIIPPFILWGVLISKDEKKLPSNLGFIDNKRVSLNEYLASYKAVQHELLLKYGERVKDVAPLINVKGEAWDRLLLLTYAKKERLKVSDSEVVNWLVSQPAFSKKGKFDPNFYKLYVTQYLRMSTRDFEEEIRQVLVIDKIRERIRSQVSLTDEELKTLYSQENSDRDLAYGIIPWEAQKGKVEISEEELTRVYELVKNQLKDPETQQILTFEEAKEQLRSLLTKQKAIELAIKKLDEIQTKTKSASFEKILSEEGIELKTFEKFKKGTYPAGLEGVDHLETTVAALKEGEVSQGFALPNGAAIVKIVKDWPTMDEKGFQEAKESFREKIMDRKFSAQMRVFIEGLRNKLNINLETMKKLFQE